jgi:hypothetical protein
VHEWGHAFGWLGDEYETAQSAHQAETVGRAANVSDTPDPTKVPWAHWIEAKHPGVGVVEGASGRPKGAWKPTSSGCTMSSGEQFCVVCQEALVLRIHAYVDPIDACEPPPQPNREKNLIEVGETPVEFRVQVMKPASHMLDVTWWVLPEARFPSTGGSGTSSAGGRTAPGGRNRPGARDRTKRGPLAVLDDVPHEGPRGRPDGQHVLKLSSKDLEPGKYLVVCRGEGHDAPARREVPLGAEGRARLARVRTHLVDRREVTRGRAASQPR